MPPLYRIRNWKEYFETHESRKYKHLQWFACPTKHDGKGFRRIMRQENCAIIFSAFVLLLELAAKCPQRGTLADHDGPLTIDDFSDKTGLKAEYFTIALKYLTNKEIGWIEILESPGKEGGCRDDLPVNREVAGIPSAIHNITEHNIRSKEPDSTPAVGGSLKKSTPEKKKRDKTAFIIGSEKITWPYWQRIVNMMHGDKFAAGRIFYRAFRKAKPGSCTAWIEGGLKGKSPYALQPITDETTMAQAVQEWIDKNIFKFKDESIQTVGEILTGG